MENVAAIRDFLEVLEVAIIKSDFIFFSLLLCYVLCEEIRIELTKGRK